LIIAPVAAQRQALLTERLLLVQQTVDFLFEPFHVRPLPVIEGDLMDNNDGISHSRRQPTMPAAML
jgi:hypothetical protein